MNRISFFVIDFLMGAFRSRVSLQLEIAALHHQLSLYQRAQRRPAIASSDRLLWSVLARLWRGWRGALFIVQPRTVILWQRKRSRDYWRGMSRGGIVRANSFTLPKRQNRISRSLIFLHFSGSI
jgi:hypothetical protein